jgi:tetratricopeptide (TPR) repeat protein
MRDVERHGQSAPHRRLLAGERFSRWRRAFATVCFKFLVACATASAAFAQPTRTAVTTQALILEGERALAAGDAARALEIATDYLRTHASSARARILAARAHLSRGQADAAYEELRRARRADPRNIDVLYYLGLVTARLSQQSFDRLVTMAPDSGRVHQLQAESLEAQENRAGAEAEYAAALRVQPDLYDALVGLARLKRIRLACDEALPLYEKAEAVRPTFETAYGLGVCHNVLQNDEVAVAHFEAAVRRDAKAAAAWVALGASLNKLGRSAEAVKTLQHAIALEPNQGQAYYFLGMAYRALKDPARAQEAFRKAEELGGAMGGASPPPVPRGGTAPP